MQAAVAAVDQAEAAAVAAARTTPQTRQAGLAAMGACMEEAAQADTSAAAGIGAQEVRGAGAEVVLVAQTSATG
jgi:hypothetical protein